MLACGGCRRKCRVRHFTCPRPGHGCGCPHQHADAAGRHRRGWQPDAPRLGDSVAYPVGVIGRILCIFVFSRMVPTRLAPAPAPPTTVEVVLSADSQGVTVGEVMAGLPSGVRLVAVRHGLTNTLPAPLVRLDAGDVLLLFGEPGAMDDARRRLGARGARAPGERPKRVGHCEILRVARRPHGRADS